MELPHLERVRLGLRLILYHLLVLLLPGFKDVKVLLPVILGRLSSQREHPSVPVNWVDNIRHGGPLISGFDDHLRGELSLFQI